jgi:hypothetical protein
MKSPAVLIPISAAKAGTEKEISIAFWSTKANLIQGEVSIVWRVSVETRMFGGNPASNLAPNDIEHGWYQ